MRAALALALAACTSAAAPRPAGSPIDAIAAEAMSAGGVVGMSIVVMRGDRTIVAAGYGSDGHAAVTAATTFPLASLSKQYWGTAVMQLVERGRLGLGDPLVLRLPGFPDPRPLVADLLQQTSGLGEDRAGEDDAAFTDLPPLAFAPGEQFFYSNRGAILARRVAELASGEPWPRYLAVHIAAPLGLAHTAVCPPTTRGFAVGATGPVPAGLDAETLARVGFVCADARDVATFARSFDQHALLRADSVAAMRTPAQVAQLPIGYGLLTRIGELGGHRAYGHTGNFPGAEAAAFRFPDDDLTIVVLENTTPRPGYTAVRIATRIARLELGLPAPSVRDLPVPADVLAACAGSYVAPGVALRVTVEHGALWGEMTRPGPWRGRLRYQGGATFLGGPAGVDPDTITQFGIAGGRARWLTWGHPLLLDGMARRAD